MSLAVYKDLENRSNLKIQFQGDLSQVGYFLLPLLKIAFRLLRSEEEKRWHVLSHFAATGTRISANTLLRCHHNQSLYTRRPIVCSPLNRLAQLRWKRHHVAYTKQQ
ncbi:hypothetical protein AVEN_87534-1 [Araneus ventricosus]|uniref:Transposase Tc1-like domain-containing protein n=1 Tax=Araneus ventricosus TaxID=182803 RepID=A0A4Y2NE80_ARAVE|nr:hypothetical protein AVEN_87534-1 [Araneus ventricosus]